MKTAGKILIVLGILVCLSIPASALHYGVHFPLKPSPPDGPYDDDDFLSTATSAINDMSGKDVPTGGNDLLELMTTQAQLSKMNISPDAFQKDSDIVAYLYYLYKAGQEYEETESLTFTPFSPVGPNNDPYQEAHQYFDDASDTWTKISDVFPDASMPSMPADTYTNQLSTNKLNI